MTLLDFAEFFQKIRAERVGAFSAEKYCREKEYLYMDGFAGKAAAFCFETNYMAFDGSVNK